MSYLTLNSVSKNFGNVKAVSNVDIAVERGSFFTLLGPSGCGKTTTLRMIAGFEIPSSGKIFMDGRDVTNVPPEKREIGMMFQNYALFPHMTVFENVAYGLKIQKLKKDEIKDKTEEYLGLVGLHGYDKRKITELSGGEQQRVALARSLVTEPKVFLMDEPLSNLDAKLRDEMRFELKRIKDMLNITMIYVTHDQNEALMMSDKIAVFNKGVVQQIDNPVAIYKNPNNSFVAQFVGNTNILEVDKYIGSSYSLSDGTTFTSTKHKSNIKKISIRNEAIHFTTSEDGTNDNKFTALVTAKQFNGMLIYYKLKINQTELNSIQINNENLPSPQVNSFVDICISTQDVRLLES